MNSRFVQYLSGLVLLVLLTTSCQKNPVAFGNRVFHPEKAYSANRTLVYPNIVSGKENRETIPSARPPVTPSDPLLFKSEMGTQKINGSSKSVVRKLNWRQKIALAMVAGKVGKKAVARRERRYEKNLEEAADPIDAFALMLAFAVIFSIIGSALYLIKFILMLGNSGSNSGFIVGKIVAFALLLILLSVILAVLLL